MGTINLTTEQINQKLYPLSIHLNQTVLEAITGNGTWQGVGTNVVKIEPTAENCDYTGGSIVIPPTPYPLTRYIKCSVSVQGVSAATNIVLGANYGVGTPATEPNTDYTPDLTLINANQEDILTVLVPIQTSDTQTTYVDFFLKGDKNFNVKNAYFILGSKAEGEL